MLLKKLSTRPGITSLSAGAAPRYGTWVSSMPATRLNNSPARCGPVPRPGEAKVSLPELALACAMNSATVFAGELFGTTTAVGYWTTSEIERIAVRRGAGGGLGGEVAAGAASVLDRHLLAPQLRELGTDQAGDG